jgi:cytochrome c oxidase subunit 3
MSATTPAGTPRTTSSPRRRATRCWWPSGMLLVIFGAGQWVNGAGWAAYVLLAGMVIWLTVLFQWFRRPSAKAKAACTPTASTSRSAGA